MSNFVTHLRGSESEDHTQSWKYHSRFQTAGQGTPAVLFWGCLTDGEGEKGFIIPLFPDLSWTWQQNRILKGESIKIVFQMKFNPFSISVLKYGSLQSEQGGENQQRLEMIQVKHPVITGSHPSWLDFPSWQRGYSSHWPLQSLIPMIFRLTRKYKLAVDHSTSHSLHRLPPPLSFFCFLENQDNSKSQLHDSH